MVDATRFQYEGFAAIGRNLNELSLANPGLKKKIDEAIWDVLGQVRKHAMDSADFKNSRHNSIQAIRRSVYKKIIGGSVSILDGKRKGNRGSFKATGQSDRTKAINSYSGKDRGFILRFVNSGTQERYAGEGRNNKLSIDYIREKRGKRGYRGYISPRNFFAPAASVGMQESAKILAQLIDDELTKRLNNNG